MLALIGWPTIFSAPLVARIIGGNVFFCLGVGTLQSNQPQTHIYTQTYTHAQLDALTQTHTHKHSHHITPIFKHAKIHTHTLIHTNANSLPS